MTVRSKVIGDPIGPLLFSNIMQLLLESLESELALGYLVDLTLGGPQSVVAADVQLVSEVGRVMVSMSANVSLSRIPTLLSVIQFYNRSSESQRPISF